MLDAVIVVLIAGAAQAAGAAWYVNRTEQRLDALERETATLRRHLASVPGVPPPPDPDVEPDPDAQAWATEWESPRGWAPWEY